MSRYGQPRQGACNSTRHLGRGKPVTAPVAGGKSEMSEPRRVTPVWATWRVNWRDRRRPVWPVCCIHPERRPR